MIIGICGKSGSGKSTLAKEFMNVYQNNVIHCDIDKIGHYVLTLDVVKNDLKNSFGASVIKMNKVDRKVLGKIVFDSPKDMEKLTDITWKYMQIEIDNLLSENQEKIIILDWQLLPKTKYFQMCDNTILLDIPYEIRKERAMLRDNISEIDFDLREKASYNYENLNFNYVINNNTKEEVQRLVRII